MFSRGLVFSLILRLFFALPLKSKARELCETWGGNHTHMLRSSSHQSWEREIGAAVEHNFKLICYFTFENNFNISQLSDLCTHVNVGFFGIDENTYKLQISENNSQLVRQVVSLKRRSKSIKVLVAIGGANFIGFTRMVKVHETRKQFIKSTIDFLEKFNADGVNLDWEWPALNGSKKERVKFIQLLYEFQHEFTKLSNDYILSVDASCSRPIIELAYYVPYMAMYVSYINLMCYDYHFYTKWFPFTGHNAPLYSSAKHDILNVNYSVHFWISNGMPKEQIVLGVPTYGHTYRLSSPSSLKLHAPSCGIGLIGKDGFASYSQVCKFLKQSNVTLAFDHISKVPYAYNYPNWVSYDNELSLAFKGTYIQNTGLAGAMVFSVNADDHLGLCSEAADRLPLLKKLRSILFNEVIEMDVQHRNTGIHGHVPIVPRLT